MKLFVTHLRVLACTCGLTCAVALGGEPDEHRLVVFGTDAPVLLRVLVETGDGGITDVRQRMAADLFSAADRDNDGTVSGEEAAQMPAMGRLRPAGQSLGEAWQQLDADSDGRLDLDELRAHVDESVGPPIAVSVRQRRLDQNVELHGRLDTDGDRHVALAEFDDRLPALDQYDFDDDEALSAAELQPFPQARQMRQQAGSPGRQATDMSVAVLRTDDDRKKAAKRIVATYGDDGQLPTERLGKLARRRDTERDGILQPDQLVALLSEFPADAELYVRLDNRRSDQIGVTGRLRQPERARLIDQPHNRRIELVVGGMPVELRLDNSAAVASDNVNFFKLQVRIADADKNGYLDEAEFGRVGLANAMFSAVDANGNDQVTADEVGEFIRKRNDLSRSQVQLVLEDTGQHLFGVLDENKDNRITPREMQQASAVLDDLDVNADGRISDRELASSLRMRFALGAPSLIPSNQAVAMDTARMPIVRPRTTGPLWFRRMDRNQDGDLTWREFLGPREDFDKLDTDSDGLISEAEAEVI